MKYKSKRKREGNLKLIIPSDKSRNISKKDPVFYNPKARLSRELTANFLKTVTINDCLDLLSASGAMGLKIAKETSSKVLLNDKNPKATKLIRKNIKINDLNNTEVSNKEANQLLKKRKKYDYIDIDPFGTPTPFLNLAVQRVNKYLGVTATDTSALSGAYPKACLRKYNSKPLKNEFMHETGLRILIKKVQEEGMKYNIPLIPIFSFYYERYMRVIFQVAKNIDEIKENLGYISYCNSCLWRESSDRKKESCPNCGASLKHAGKLWKATLWDDRILSKIINQNNSYEARKLLGRIKSESKIKKAGFYDLHKIGKKYKWEEVPKIKDNIARVKDQGFKAGRTHFSPTGIKTNASINVFI